MPGRQTRTRTPTGTETQAPTWPRLGRALPPAVAVLILLGAWELYVDSGGANPLFLPPPHAVAAAMVDERGELWANFWVTARELVLGILLGVFVAVLLSVLIHLSSTLRRALYPLLVASQAVPIVLVAVVLVIWLGFGLGTKLVIIGLVSFFPVVVSTLDALEATDPELIKLMRTFGAGPVAIFRFVELPAALPGVFTGTKLAAVFAVTGVVFAEQSGSNAGLGYLFGVSVNQLQGAVAFAAVTLLVLVAVVIFALLGALQRWLTPWASASRH